MNPLSQKQKDMPVKIVGSTIFGRYPKISSERTYNMFISDGWLVPTPGYKKFVTLDPRNVFKGRGIFVSNILDKFLAVVSTNVYLIDSTGYFNRIGTLESPGGDVYIAENNAKQIIICDQLNFYIYNYDEEIGVSVKKVIKPNFTPIYVTFQDGYFIAATDKAEWRLSDLNNGGDGAWKNDAHHTGSFQTKPDRTQACISLPGKGSQLFIMGTSITESWANVGASLFPYQRNSGYNIDYGCVSVATIAYGENIVVWLASNKRANIAIMYSSGGEAAQISTDGINFKFSTVKYPKESYGFLYKQDGHLFYQLSFVNKEDDFSLIYDFTTQKFFNIADRQYNAHIAKKIILFNGKYYFISHSDGNIYEMSSEYTTYDGNEIPRSRITNNVRFADSSGFVTNRLTFPMEQGEDAETARVDLSISRDGGQTFGNKVGVNLNPLGKRKGKIDFWQLGYANDFLAQLEFWGKGRFVVSDGLLSIQK